MCWCNDWLNGYIKRGIKLYSDPILPLEVIVVNKQCVHVTTISLSFISCYLILTHLWFRLYGHLSLREEQCLALLCSKALPDHVSRVYLIYCSLWKTFLMIRCVCVHEREREGWIIMMKWERERENK